MSWKIWVEPQKGTVSSFLWVVLHLCCHLSVSMSVCLTCADPGIFARGGPGQPYKKALTTFFFFFSPQLILQKSNGQFQRNLSFFKVPEGVQHFPGGSNFFQGGSNCLFSIETHITCDFPGGVQTPSPPLDPHLAWDVICLCRRLLLLSIDLWGFSPVYPFKPPAHTYTNKPPDTIEPLTVASYHDCSYKNTLLSHREPVFPWLMVRCFPLRTLPT